VECPADGTTRAERAHKALSVPARQAPNDHCWRSYTSHWRSCRMPAFS
jgi:hypothetical protein